LFSAAPRFAVAAEARMPDQSARVFVIKAEILDPDAATFTFLAQKTMYSGRLIAVGDIIYLFASENEGGQGLVARGIVTATAPLAMTGLVG
jgi:hypothetical protein